MLDVLALLPFIVTATAALSATAPRVQLTFSPAHAIHEGTVGTLASRSISQAGQAPSHTAVVWATPTRVRTRSKQRSPWDETDILAPDVTDLDTLTELSRLASNAYNEPGSKSWYDVPGWNNTLPIGTEDPSGMRGHLFASSDNSTIVLAVKGTNLPFSGPTSGRDKQNDNTMFSCCCAHSACSCASRGNKCDTACLETALAEESMFYNFGIVSAHAFSCSSLAEIFCRICTTTSRTCILTLLYGSLVIVLVALLPPSLAQLSVPRLLRSPRQASAELHVFSTFHNQLRSPTSSTPLILFLMEPV